jgi:hypothetical protein
MFPITSAAAISRKLRAAGFNPLGSGSSRNRQGLRVSSSVAGVRVVADLDNQRAAADMAADAREALAGSYDLTEVDGGAFYVTGRA